MKYLVSAFSIQMMPHGGRVEFSEVDETYLVVRHHGIVVPWFDKAVIGHQGTVNVINKLLESFNVSASIAVSREPIRLMTGDELLIAQPVGTRLAVGAEVEEPELRFYRLDVRFAYY